MTKKSITNVKFKRITEDHLREIIENDLLNIDDIKQITKNQKLVETLIDEEHNTGHALVDVQNWLSKDGKLATEIINKYLRDILIAHGIELRE